MAQYKAHEVDRYIAQPDKKHRIILIYGPDTGAVSEKASNFAKALDVDLGDPFATIKLDAEDAAADKNRIADEAHTVSMFGGDRLIWIKGSTQKNLAGALQAVLDTPPSDAFVLVEGGDLKKSSPLRTRVEKSASGVALPCYTDQSRDLDSVIDQEMAKHKLTISRDAKELLKSLLGGDRLASRSEIQKLCLFAMDDGEVSQSHILEIVGDASALAIDTVIDAAATGDMKNMEHTLKRLVARGTSPVQIVGAAQRYFQTLHNGRVQIESRRLSPQAVVGSMRPPVNFMRRNSVTRALNLWRLDALTRVLDRLESTSLDVRRSATMAEPLLTTALMAITIEARRSSR